MSHRTLHQRVLLKTVTLVFMLIAFSIISILSSPVYAGQENSVRVTSKAPLLEVVSVKKIDRQVWLLLKNGYEKKITAIAIDMPTPTGGAGISTDLVVNSQDFLAGANYEFRLALSRYQTDSKAERQGPDIVILAILFEDHTGDGDTDAIADLAARRLGGKIQATRILPLIQDALRLSDEDLPTGLEKLKKQIASLSVDVEASGAFDVLRSKYPSISESSTDKLTATIRTGLHGGIEWGLFRIQEVERELLIGSKVNLRKRLNTIKEYYEMLIVSL